MSTEAYRARLNATGRNDLCPCGSGAKYKKCHLSEDRAAVSAELKKLEEEAKAAALAKAEAEGEGEDAAAQEGAAKGSSKKRAPRQAKTASAKSQTGGKPKNLPRRRAV